MTAEDWKLIAGYPDYWVSNTGRVVSCRGKEPREMGGSRNQRGYRMVLLRGSNGEKTLRTVHRLVATAFLGPLPEGMQTRHLDGDKSNNAVSNLAFCTPSQNILDQVTHGVHNNARKTHCPRNHPYDEMNTYFIPSSGGRMCRTCQSERRAAQAFAAAGIPA